MLDPMDWNTEQVKFWLEWAIGQFTLEGVVVDQFDLTGVELCNLAHDDFVQLVPNDVDNIFWTHLELLRKCKFVGTTVLGCNTVVDTIVVYVARLSRLITHYRYNRG
jgi:Sterile alpha motif (SAM)/Pointed domain